MGGFVDSELLVLNVQDGSAIQKFGFCFFLSFFFLEARKKKTIWQRCQPPLLPSIPISYGQRCPLDFLLVVQVSSADGAEQQMELGILKKTPWEGLLLLLPLSGQTRKWFARCHLGAQELLVRSQAPCNPLNNLP